MTILIRRHEDIHHEQGGWFSARWHFSFSHYRDDEQMGFGPLRVFNDDQLIPGAVWPMHPHRDIEGITWVIEGTFRHSDSLGNAGTLQAGALQRATLGSGLEHSEQNGSDERPVHFLQFWILPDTADLTPSLEQRQFDRDAYTNQLLRVAGPRDDDLVHIHQDASVHVTFLEEGHAVTHAIEPGRGVYAYLINGRAELNGYEVRSGDAARVFDEPLTIGAQGPSELLLVDVPLEFERVGIWAGDAA